MEAPTIMKLNKSKRDTKDHVVYDCIYESVRKGKFIETQADTNLPEKETGM